MNNNSKFCSNVNYDFDATENHDKARVQEDIKIMSIVRKITERGNDAEIRGDRNGDLKIIEVKKNVLNRYNIK